MPPPSRNQMVVACQVRKAGKADLALIFPDLLGEVQTRQLGPILIDRVVREKMQLVRTESAEDVLLK